MILRLTGDFGPRILTYLLIGDTKILIKISFTPKKRADTLAERGLDFLNAALVFNGRTATIQDLRFDYGEDRFIYRRHPSRPARRDGLDPTR
jgi:hypothetical protein